MINFIAWIIVGAATGALISLVTRSGVQSGLIRNIVVGILGAFVGGPMLTLYLGLSVITENILSFPALLMSLIGAAALVALAMVMLRGRQWLGQRLARLRHS